MCVTVESGVGAGAGEVGGVLREPHGTFLAERGAGARGSAAGAGSGEADGAGVCVAGFRAPHGTLAATNSTGFDGGNFSGEGITRATPQAINRFSGRTDRAKLNDAFIPVPNRRLARPAISGPKPADDFERRTPAILVG
jgi:hypothetical protein